MDLSKVSCTGRSRAFDLCTSSFENTKLKSSSSALAAHSNFRKTSEVMYAVSEESNNAADNISSLQPRGNRENCNLNGGINGCNPLSGKSLNTNLQVFATEEEDKKGSLEAVSLNSSKSGSVSMSSGENEASSSDPEDMEEEGDPSDGKDSDREIPHLTHGTSDAQKRTPCTSHGSTARHMVPTAAQQTQQSISLMSSLHRKTSAHHGPLLSTLSEGTNSRPAINNAKGQNWRLFADPVSPLVSSPNPLFLASSKCSDLPKLSEKPMHRQLTSLCVRNAHGNIPSRRNHLHRNASEKPASTRRPSAQDTNLCNLISQSPSLITSNLASLDRHSLSSPGKNSARPFLNSHATKFIQDAPLALVTKKHKHTNILTAPYSQTPEPMDLSTSGGERPSISLSKVIQGSQVQRISSKKLKIDDTDDSLEDETEASDSNTADSGNSLEINSESEDDIKESSEVNRDGYRTPGKFAKFLSKSSPSPLANCSLLCVDIFKTPCPPLDSLGKAAGMTSLETFKTHNSTASFKTVPLPVPRKRITDEEVLRIPLDFGWQRVMRVQTLTGRLQGEVCYYAPCGKKLRHYPDVMKYLSRHGISEISRDNFSFSTKIKLGDFYKAKEGLKGLQWVPLAEEEKTSCIFALDGRRQRKAQAQQTLNGTGVQPLPQDVCDTNLLRKPEAQEPSRHIKQMKIMRKLEKQVMAKAAKEAKKQQAMLEAEERRKKKEEMKILKQQEKIRRIQQIRLEKEVRAQQILEAKKRRREEAINAKLLEAEKRDKEREIRRMHAVFQKHQEREKRRQHLMLLKEVESRKKAEEKERLKKENKERKLLNKEKTRLLKRLELEKAKEMKKPTEDLCLTDHKSLPDLSRIPGLVLSERTVSDCLMVLQFVHSFGQILGLNAPTLSELQEGLLNMTDKVQELLVALVSAAVKDPSLVQSHKMKTAFGEVLPNVKLDQYNVSEVLRLFMESDCDLDSSVSSLALSLRTRDFGAHQPSDKASILAYLVNKLCCCKAVVSEIDRTIDKMAKLRKEKWIVEGSLRKLRNIHAKKTGRKTAKATQTCDPATENKSKRKEGYSEEEDGDDESDVEEAEEDEGKTSKKTTKEEENIDSPSVEEVEKKIEKTVKQHTELRQKLLETSYSLRSMMMGQDRYKRCYWLLPQCGGVFVEGIRTQQGYRDTLKEKRPECERCTKGLSLLNSGSLYPLCDLQTEPSTVPDPPSNGHSQPQTSDVCATSNPEVPMDAPLKFLLSELKCASPPLHHYSSVFVNQRITHFPSSLSHTICQCFVSTSQTLAAHSAERGMQQQRVVSGTHQGGGILCGMSSELMSSGLPFTGSSASPMRDLASQHAQGKAHSVPFQTSYSSVSETEPPSDRPHRAWSPTEEVASSQQPVPEDMLNGWWWMSNVEEVQNLSKALHCRGIRERALTKQTHKHMEYMAQLCATKDAAVIDVAELQKQTHCKKMVDRWCVEDQAIKSDICALKQVEALEMRVISAGLRVKGWTPRDAQSQQHNSPLCKAVHRLAELEKNIKHRGEDAPWRTLWHKALSEVQSPAQLVLCVQQLQKAIPWDSTIQKVESVDCLRTRQRQTRTSGVGKKASEVQPNSKPSVSGELIKEEAASRIRRAPKKSIKEVKTREADNAVSKSEANYGNPGSKNPQKFKRGGSTDEMEMCQLLSGELPTKTQGLSSNL